MQDESEQVGGSIAIVGSQGGKDNKKQGLEMEKRGLEMEKRALWRDGCSVIDSPSF